MKKKNERENCLYSAWEVNFTFMSSKWSACHWSIEILKMQFIHLQRKLRISIGMICNFSIFYLNVFYIFYLSFGVLYINLDIHVHVFWMDFSISSVHWINIQDALNS
jgi:hypothetical protein